MNSLVSLRLFTHFSSTENKKEDCDGSNVYRCQIGKPYGDAAVLNKNRFPVSHFILPTLAISKSLELFAFSFLRTS
jgi:hypothetical protein